MHARRQFLSIALLALIAIASAAQRRHDPLTAAEIDQLRDTAMEPEQRLKLYVKFARARLATLEEKRNDPKVADRGRATHDGLEDFLAVYDELNDNVDTYVDRKDDIRKPLKAVIEADTEFQAKLRALNSAAGVSPQEKNEYQFVLSNAIDTIDSSAEDHRKLMAEQEEAAKHKKKPGKGQ
jgi:hypothetical protein